MNLIGKDHVQYIRGKLPDTLAVKVKLMQN